MYSLQNTKHLGIVCVLVLCLMSVFSACMVNTVSTPRTAAPTPMMTATTIPTMGPSMASPTHIPPGILPTSTPIVTIVPATPGIAPTLLLTPTPVPGGRMHSQQVILADRTLVIDNINRSSGTDASSISIALTITLKNTSKKAITNLASYYSLFGSEGDVFGLPLKSKNALFGIIAARSSRSGTLVFQVPLGADKALRLLYRPEVARETVFVALNV